VLTETEIKKLHALLDKLCVDIDGDFSEDEAEVTDGVEVLIGEMGGDDDPGIAESIAVSALELRGALEEAFPPEEDGDEEE
jgi:hypothetical protein